MSGTKPTVLFVEDEAQMRRFVRLTLETHGYRVLEAETGEEGLRQAAAYTPDLILLDLGLPDLDGLDVAKRLREWSPVPIIVLSARGQEEIKIRVLDEGADDYLTKPFGTGELMARIRVALRHAARAEDAPESAFSIGDLRIDLVKRLVFRGADEVHLTPIEYKLLATLARNNGKVMTHRQLLERVWGPGNAHRTEYLRVYMTQLRHKLERDPARPKYLVTEPGVGYRMRSEETAAPE